MQITYTIDNDGSTIYFDTEGGVWVATAEIDWTGEDYELSFEATEHSAAAQAEVWAVLPEAVQEGLQQRWEAYQEMKSRQH